MTTNTYNAIIIGGGHNGLVAAAISPSPCPLPQGDGYAPAKVVKLPFYEPEWKKK